MFKNWFSGIFGFFFLRSTLAITTLATVLLLILMPFFKSQLLEMVKTQGASFANTTIAATASNLYKKEFGDALQYVQTVLKNTPDILFVVITDINGQEIVITAKNWELRDNTLKYRQVRLSPSKNLLVYPASSPVADSSSFLYHQIIEISEVPWGVLSVGLSDHQYHYILSRYFLTVSISSILLVISLLVLFYRNAARIRLQIESLSNTALQLQHGNLDARASETAIGEIGVLGIAVNNMSSSLKEQSARLFQLAQIVEQTNDAFVLLDDNFKIIFVNDAIADLTGFDVSVFRQLYIHEFIQLLQLRANDLIEELKGLAKNDPDMPNRDVVIVKKDQLALDVEMRMEKIEDAQRNALNYLLVFSDISKRKTLEKELHQLAFYDKLTGLPNRRMFLDQLHKTITYAQRYQKSFALFFLDLDNFKYINDTLGHEAGDLLLIQVGEILKHTVRNSDTVARLGGDEFTVIIQDTEHSAAVEISHLAEKVLASLVTQPVMLGDRPLTISTSVGIATYPDNGLDADTVLKNADTAMYSAKKSGKNRYAFFSEEMNASLKQHIELESDLKKALLQGGQITLFYQPILELTTLKLMGAEALVRWQHPTKGMVLPGDFIPVAEMSDLIISLSEVILETGFRQAKQWADQGFTPYLSLNISVRQFEKPYFIEYLTDLLHQHQVDPGKIQLEFTESIMLKSGHETIEKFEQLKALGFIIAIDDFGTGYSSLGYIHKLPIDVIKIDRAFIADMLDDRKTQAIVAAISGLSTSLEIKTIAEGVELNAHVERLKHYHCNFGQGYLFDKPLSLNNFEHKYFFQMQQAPLRIIKNA